MPRSEAAPGASLGTLLTLAWPIVLARATQSVIGFTDALFVAPLGEAPLAATTTGSLDAFAAIIFPVGTVFIIQSFVAQLRGSGDTRSVHRYAVYGLLLAAASGVLAAGTIPLIPHAVALFDYSPEVARLLETYLGIRLLSVAPAVGMEVLGNWYGGLGNTRPAMFAGIVAMLVNVAGCIALVEPRFGLPGYGVAGAAWASVLGSVAGFGVVLALFLRESRGAEGRARGDLRLSELVRMLRFGVPNGLNWFLEFFAFVLFINLVVGHLGTTVLAAFNVVMQINSVSFMPAFGLSSAGAILVGETLGRREPEHVWPIVRRTGIVSAAWMGSVGLVYALLPVPLMSLFRPRDAPADLLLDTGATMLLFAAVWQLFDAVIMTVSEALRAAGDTTWCMAARILIAWVVFTPLAWAAVFVFGGGVKTVMTSLIAYLAVLALAMTWRFASGRWKTIDLLGRELLQ